jgi:hypothetical protein
MGRLQLGKKFGQIIQSDKFQQAAQGAAQGALGSLQSSPASTSVQTVAAQKEPFPKEYLVAAAIIIAALVGRR